MEQQKLIAELKAQLEKAVSAADALVASSAKTLSAVKKVDGPKIKFTGLVKAYMDAIKKSDGLTSARPATLKAVQDAEKKPSSDTVSKARDALQKHAAELKKASGKDKKFAKFEARMNDIDGQLGKLL